MSNYIKEFSNYILALKVYTKRIIAIINDVGLCVLCTWLAFVLRLEELTDKNATTFETDGRSQ